MNIQDSGSLRRVTGVTVGFIFVFAATMKVPDLLGVTEDVQQILRVDWIGPQFLLALFAFEFLVGCGLVFKRKERACWLGAVCLLSIFSGWLGYGFLTGAFETCSCFGDYLKMPLEWAIVRNLVMWVVATFCFVRMLRA
jgi:hypothetical protein